MAMTGAGMAERIRSDMGFPLPVSQQLIGWGTGVVTHIQNAALVNHASGLVTGTAPPSGGPLSSGAADQGLISSMTGSTMADLVEVNAGYGFVTSQLLTFCNEIVSHIESLGRVEFSSGDITGTCTNTAISPGPLSGGAGTDGFIKLLNGPVLAAAIHAAVGYPGSVSTPLIEFCTAVVGYIMDNAEVTHTTVTATCPAGGGAITSGTGVNGTVA